MKEVPEDRVEINSPPSTSSLTTTIPAPSSPLAHFLQPESNSPITVQHWLLAVYSLKLKLLSPGLEAVHTLSISHTPPLYTLYISTFGALSSP